MERFAELRAEIERSGDRDQVLRGAGISPRAWMHVQRRWLGELAGEVALGRTALAEKYRRAFEAGAKAAPEAASAGPAAQPGSRPAEAPLIMPSYMVGARPHPEASPSAPAPVPPVAASPAPTPPAHRRGATLQGNSGLRGPATPFRAGPPSPEVAQPSPRKEPPAPGGGPGTGTSLVVDIPRALITPFQKHAETAKAGAPPASTGAPPLSAAPAGGAPTAAKPAPGPPVNAAPASLTGTALASPLAALAAAIPFKAKAPAAAQPPASPSSPAPPQAGAPASPSNPAAPQAGAPASSSNPAAPQAGAGPLPELTVEQYAWLVAALRRTRGPAEVEHAFRALRLSPDVQKPLEERWRARMAADPALQQRFLAALATHLSGAAR